MNVTTSLIHTFNNWIASASFSLPGKQKNSSQLSSSYIQAGKNSSQLSSSYVQAKKNSSQFSSSYIQAENNSSQFSSSYVQAEKNLHSFLQAMYKQKTSSQLSSSYIQAENNESLPEYIYSTTLYRETVSSRKRDQNNRSTVHWEWMIHRRMLFSFLPSLRIKGLTRRAYNGIWFRARRTRVEEARKNRIIVSEDNSRPRLSRKKREKSKASCDVQCHDGYQSSTTQSQHSRHPCVPGLLFSSSLHDETQTAKNRKILQLLRSHLHGPRNCKAKNLHYWAPWEEEEEEEVQDFFLVMHARDGKRWAHKPE